MTTEAEVFGVPSKEDFAHKIYELARLLDCNLIDAIVFFSEENEIPMEEIIPMLDRSIREDIQQAAIKDRYVIVEKTPTLEI